jgi:hypothetical protein
MGRPPIGKKAMTSTERSRRRRAGMVAKPDATKPSRHATKPDPRDQEIARLMARVAELEQVIAAGQGSRAETKKDRTKPTWISSRDTIIVATKSKRAQAWALKRFTRKGKGKGAPYRPFFDEPIASDVVKGLNSEGYVLSLEGDAIEAIQAAAREGKLKSRGKVAIEPAEWATLELSAEGELFRVQKGLALGVAYQDAEFELRGVRRHFPQSSGRGGTQLAEFVCREWLRSHKSRPVRRKADVWKEAQRKFGVSSHAFIRAWKTFAPKEWKRRGRPRKPAL